jgi:D-3-phosphoglycerate dehydrogenase
MNVKVLANDGIAPSGKKALESKGFTVITETVAQDDLIDVINKEGYEVVLVRSATTVRKEVMDSCPGLKMIGRGGVGMDNIDVQYGRDNGLVVFNTPAASSLAVAELVIGQLFSISRSTFDSERNMPTKGNSDFKVLKKKYGKGVELRGKTLGVIGFGRIGQYTAQYALGCGMNVIASDPFVKDATVSVEVGNQSVDVKIDMVSKDDLLSKADYISLHVPMPKEGSVITKSEFNKMKDGVRIVNAARGGVINEDDLLEALNNGKVAACSLDVFVGEPSPRADILTHDKISLTPHVGAATVEAQDRIGTELASQIINFYNN